MAAGGETLRLLGGRRAVLNGIVDDVTRQSVAGWARAWDALVSDLESTLVDAASSLSEGRRLTLQSRRERLQSGLARMAWELDDLAAAGRVTLTDAAGRAVSVSRDFDGRVVASQFPATAGTTANLGAQFSGRVAPDAFDAILRRSAEQITSLTRPIPETSLNAVRQELVRGITVGDNPRATASRMLARMEQRFAGGLSRTLTIARTETLDAYRQANMAFGNVNADLLQGWQWFAELDDRTCVACVALHGETFSLEEPGPDGHQNCRCTRLDVLRPWSELGFDVPEPESIFPSRDNFLDGLDEDARIRLFGPARDAMLRDGTATLRDFVQERPADGWRRSFGVAPLSAI